MRTRKQKAEIVHMSLTLKRAPENNMAISNRHNLFSRAECPT